jgi:hypothetical protein
MAGLISVRAAGVALIALGLGTDLAAGLLILDGDVATGLATHIPAVMVWALGAKLIGRDPIVGGTIALATFPGIGTAGLTLAGVIWPFLTIHSRRSEPGRQPIRVEAERPVPEVPAVNQLLELEVQPLVDALRDGDPVLKRGAVDFLGRQPRADAVRLVRRLISDPDLEVRSEAAVMLSRLETDITRAIFAASDEVEKSPRDPEMHGRLGRLLREYAESGLPERVLRHHQLLQARKALVRALELDHESAAAAERWLDLARVHHDLGQLREAHGALDRALALAGSDSDKATEIALQVALAERNWPLMHAMGWPAVDKAEGELELRVPRRVAPEPREVAGRAG